MYQVGEVLAAVAVLPAACWVSLAGTAVGVREGLGATFGEVVAWLRLEDSSADRAGVSTSQGRS